MTTAKSEDKKIRAIALLSGGLDSTLAISVMLDLGVDVEALNFTTIFCNCTSSRKEQGCGNEARRVSKLLGVELKVFNAMPEYMEVVKHPKHGRGSSMNPCIDCRIFMFKKAKQYMKQTGADFIITGEVLGQRPMSQHRQSIQLIERESGLEGMVVRPLSAKLLSPSIPEEEGLIDREQLLAISGRSRKPQMQLASDKGISDYACPAGGCLLTDKSFGRRLKDLLDLEPDADVAAVKLLKYGRHFRLPNGTKIIVGRDKAENDMLERLGRNYVRYQVKNLLGAVTLAPSGLDDETKRLVAAVTARYSQGKENSARSIRCSEDDREELLEVTPAKDEELARWRID
jgi:tRNA U34 2-thiouridine synthase MnmA/TrmU